MVDYFTGANSVYATDVDGDGDLDVLGAADIVDDITWWENANGAGTSWTEHTVDGSFDGARSVYAADLDDDGDMDILGTAYNADDITWWENTGTELSYTVTSTAPASMGNSVKDDVLKLVVEHKGISGDSDIELSAWRFLLEETDSDPLTTAEAKSIIENLFVYLDDGGGSYDGGDTLVVTMDGDELRLASGVQTIYFDDGALNARIRQTDSSKTFFLVVEMSSNAESQGIATLRVSFDPDSDSLNEDRSEDSMLMVATSSETNTGNVPIPEFPTVAAPVAGVLLLFGVARRRRGPARG